MEFIPWKTEQTDHCVVNPAEVGLPAFVCHLLFARGCHTPAAMHALLENNDSKLYDPYAMQDMNQAVERLRRALTEGERILVYGDYDCDGVTATVMLYDYLENAGADLLYYIPQREEEGYGLNMEAVSRIHKAGVQLIVTVDNGISSLDEIAKAVSLGIDVIVTDHHRPREQLPVCTAVLNPHRADCAYPFKDLCGAGVVFKLISAMENDTEGLMADLYGDLLAVATMADVVPLCDENKTLVRKGLEVLKNTERPGLAALAQVAGVNLDTVTGEQISFAIAPRINVTGRIDSVDLAVELLLTQDEEEAARLASIINELNQKRKDIEAEIVTAIGQQLTEQPQLTAARVLVVCGKGWHPGVIGITCARLVERYRKPCIVLSRLPDGELRGSARSVEGFSIIEAISSCAPHLLKYGGHPMAAGLSLSADKLVDFTQALELYAQQNYPVMPRYCLSVDCNILPAEVSLDTIALLNRLQPYGCGNPQPMPVLRGMTLSGITPIGGGNHLRLALSSPNGNLEAVYFSMTAAAFPIPVGTVVDLAVSLSVNTYQGTTKPSVRVVSMQPQGFHTEARLHGQELYDAFCRGEALPQGSEELLFSRASLSAVFRLLRELSPYGGGIDWLTHRLGTNPGCFLLLVSLDILCELGLISAERIKHGMVYTVLPSQGKADFSQAPTYQKLLNLNLVKREG
ncbi:MAG: single-stranded-DNA-specific exonuclease RecJ [Angelakisella sp.]